MNARPEKLSRRKARIVARLAAENRDFVRGKFKIAGRFLAANGWEYPCEVVDISPGGLLVNSEQTAHPGENIVLALDQLGRVNGEVVRQTATGFAMSIQSTVRKRDAIADQLTWQLNAERLGLSDDRSQERKQRKDQVYLSLRDGVTISAKAIDVSMSGMAISAKENVAIGEKVWIGRLQGTVIRQLDDGFAVRFDPPTDLEASA